MIYFGFDHHKRWTQAVAMDEQARVLREGRVLNDSVSRIARMEARFVITSPIRRDPCATVCPPVYVADNAPSSPRRFLHGSMPRAFA